MSPVKAKPRCVFLMEDHPVTPNAPGGGPAVIRHHLELLAHSGVDISLLVVVDASRSFGFEAFVQTEPEEWRAVRDLCSSYRVLRFNRLQGLLNRATRLGAAVVHPVSYLTSYLDGRDVATLRTAIGDIDPDFIWAENLVPAALALRTSAKPIVYSHIDWVWRVWRLTSERTWDTWQSRLVCTLMRRGEESLARRVTAIVSTSTADAAELVRLKPDQVAYVPPAYPPAALQEGAVPSEPARIVHVGGMPTPASRLGLEQFIDRAWPAICGSQSIRPELWVIGSLEFAPEALRRKLEAAGAICTGFVQDLSSVLRPYDLHIVPWEYATGTRMKMPLAFNYAQVLIGTRTTARCLPELVDGENCVLVDSVEGMAASVDTLLSDTTRRKQLGDSARRTFLTHYTRSAVQSQFDSVLARWRLSLGL